MTRSAATGAPTAVVGFRSVKRSHYFTVAFLLVATAVLADVIRVCECRSFAIEESRHSQRGNRDTDDAFDDYQNDGAGDDEDEDSESEPGGGNNNPSTAGGPPPKILTTSLKVSAAQGTTVNLPCKMSEGSLDDIAVTWSNGTKNILTDTRPNSPDPRIKLGEPFEPSLTRPTNYTLKIENVNLWDSGTYTCKITSTPPAEITHTLHVTQPARIDSIQSASSTGSLSNVVVKKLVVKQDEPVQLKCVVEGSPKPMVQWTKKGKHHQHPSTTTTGHDQNTVQQSQQPTVVSETNEVRIESVSYKDAGSYECIAHNSDVTDPAEFSRLSIELEVEYKPEVSVTKNVVNTGETYEAKLSCNVQSRPKSKVTWERERISDAGSSSWESVITDSSNKRYSSKGPVGSRYDLILNPVRGQPDFGNYRCKAENKYGISYSGNILLSGTPAEPRSTFVKPFTAAEEAKMPELRWTVDSWSPLLEYQLQYKKQQDSNWTDVRPQPVVTAANTSNNAGDENNYTVKYVLGVNEQDVSSADVIPSSLEPGTTYVARLRALNVHGWSNWSADVVFSGGIDKDQLRTNEIPNQQHDDSTVSKASVGGNSSGAVSNLRKSRDAVVTAFVLAILVAANTVH